MGSSNFFYLASNQRCLRVERNNWRGGAPKGTILELSFGICVNAATDGDISWRNSSVALIFWRHFSGTRGLFPSFPRLDLDPGSQSKFLCVCFASWSQGRVWLPCLRREDKMKVDNWIGSCSAAPLLVIVCAAVICAAPIASAAPGNAQITVLYDAFGKTSTMQKDWGYAALVEYDGKRVLFDTGNNPDILAQNAKAKGVDLTKLDFVVMSHRHGDHMGGLTYVLKVNPTV